MNHKRITRMGTIFIMSMVIILMGVVPASAQAERIYFSGEDCPIYMGAPEKAWVSDGMLHTRGTPMITTLNYEPFLGKNYVVANTDVDLATGKVHVYGSVEIRPDAGGGTWVGRFSTHIYPDGVIEGNAVAKGTGEYEGMITFNSISAPAAPNPACGNLNTASNGYILIPHE